MTDKPKQKAPRTVRLYPPVERAWSRIDQEDNFNYYVNYCLAEKMGIPANFEIYKRPKPGEDNDN